VRTTRYPGHDRGSSRFPGRGRIQRVQDQGSRPPRGDGDPRAGHTGRDPTPHQPGPQPLPPAHPAHYPPPTLTIICRSLSISLCSRRPRACRRWVARRSGHGVA
jgi:hypothetical protein